mgnify:CR=1 FL=1
MKVITTQIPYEDMLAVFQDSVWHHCCRYVNKSHTHVERNLQGLRLSKIMEDQQETCSSVSQEFLEHLDSMTVFQLYLPEVDVKYYAVESVARIDGGKYGTSYDSNYCDVFVQIKPEYVFSERKPAPIPTNVDTRERRQSMD